LFAVNNPADAIALPYLTQIGSHTQPGLLRLVFNDFLFFRVHRHSQMLAAFALFHRSIRPSGHNKRLAVASSLAEQDTVERQGRE
jgi:hypothetical protein